MPLGWDTIFGMSRHQLWDEYRALPDVLRRPLPKLPPSQEHDCYATCATAKGSHSSTWAECPEKLKADAKVHQQAYRRRLATPQNRSTNHLLLRKHRTTTVPDPSLAIAIQKPRSESTINDKIRSTTETRPTERQDASHSPAAQAPATSNLSQPLSPSPSPRGLKACLYTYHCLSFIPRCTCPPNVVTNATNQPPVPIPTTIQDLFLYISAKFDTLERRVGALEEALGHSFRNPNKRARSLSARPALEMHCSPRTAHKPMNSRNPLINLAMGTVAASARNLTPSKRISKLTITPPRNHPPSRSLSRPSCIGGTTRITQVTLKTPIPLILSL
ncbi:hypothetical protein HPB48_013397 [Haemaphysalis longicornis]|uniref:Uncharacterized protein n=1 Tax=Haemaphysalis longicornis TaxID=44386 RepID=A0A9J6G6R0_HAELO|nr:hypothetical protein HPB48_013397 [Haemaphysalis longicornis]